MKKKKKKSTCHFSLEWKKIPAQTKVSGQEPSPPPPGWEEKTGGVGGGKGKEKEEGETTGVRGGTIFYSQSES